MQQLTQQGDPSCHQQLYPSSDLCVASMDIDYKLPAAADGHREKSMMLLER
jgi:hypothetical protein